MWKLAAVAAAFALMHGAWHWRLVRLEKQLNSHRRNLREKLLRLWAWERQLINIENAIDDQKKPE